MSPERIYRDFLKDILDALQKCRQFVAGMSFEQFADDDKSVFAVIRALEIVGEATNGFQGRYGIGYDEVPWREMAGMRDKLIHHYFGVDLRVVWKTVVEDVPTLIPAIQRVIAEEEARK